MYLDIVTKNLAMLLGSSLAQSFSSLTATSHVGIVRRHTLIYMNVKEVNAEI